jgi:hypothetical protein
VTRRALQGEVVAFSEEIHAGLIRSDDGGWFILRLEDFGAGRLYPLRGEIVVFEAEGDLRSAFADVLSTSPGPVGRAVRAKRLVDIAEAEAEAARNAETARAERHRRAERSRKTASARWDRVRAKQGQHEGERQSAP